VFLKIAFSKVHAVATFIVGCTVLKGKKVMKLLII
jgi:hypothetical protein